MWKFSLRCASQKSPQLKRYIMKIAYLLIPLLFVASCSNPNEISGGWHFGGGFKYPDSEQNDLFIKKLTDNNVKYTTNDDGVITYGLRDLATVRMIRDAIEGNDQYVFGKTYVFNQDDNFINLFQKKADESNIRVEYQSSITPHFLWEFKHQEEIHKLEQEVKFELIKLRRESYMSDKK